MICFLMHIFKQPQYHSIYWDIWYIRAAKQILEHPVAYYHINREANYITDEMARWVLKA